MQLSNTKHPKAFDGSDFTEYPLGDFNIYDPNNPKVTGFLNPTNPGTAYTIIDALDGIKRGLQVQAETVITTFPCLHRFYSTRYSGIQSSVRKVWARYRMGGATTLFNTTPLATNAGIDYCSFALWLKNPIYLQNSALRVMEVDVDIARNPAISSLWYPVITIFQQSFISPFPATTTLFNGTPTLAPSWYKDGNFHDFFVLFEDLDTRGVRVRLWIDNNMNNVADVTSFDLPGNNIPPRGTLSGLRFNANYPNGIGTHTVPSEDKQNFSLLELIDANEVYNPYKLIIDPVTQVFNTYESTTGSYQFYDTEGFPVTIKFNKGQTPSVRFIDLSPTTLDSIPRIQEGDWVDITVDANPLPILAKRFQYLNHNEPQSFLVDSRNTPLVTVYRNRSNPVIKTSPANLPSGANL